MLTKLFFAGDLMCGRGIDQVLPQRGDPAIHEAYAQHAGDYVRLAEQKNGKIPTTVDYSYPWGVALARLRSDGHTSAWSIWKPR
jgi:poly-gamma-glutamate synthesis protein (capsule biosynthesis protein)